MNFVWHLRTVPCPGGAWRTRAENADGRTLAVGEPQDSQLAAQGDLVSRHPHLFGIISNLVINTSPEGEEAKDGY